MDVQSSKENNFNLLRFIFASLVVISHCPPLVDGNHAREPMSMVVKDATFGELAVGSFFILSGYLIVKSWVNRPDAFNFLKNRVLRIFPAFAVCILVCAFLVAPFGGRADYFERLDIPLLLSGIIKFSPPKIPEVFFDQPLVQAGVNGSVWTIAYEFKCYLLVLCAGLLAGKRLRAVWLLILAASVAVHAWNHFGGGYPFNPYGPRLVMHFAFGACFFLFADDLLGRRHWMLVAAILFAISLGFREVYDLSLGLFWGYLILSFGTARPLGVLGRFNALPDVSYGLYLYAWPLTKLFIHWFPQLSLPWLTVVTLLASVACGAVSWHLIEKPALRFKTWRPRLA